MAILHQALQAANPLQLTIEDVTLFENSGTSVSSSLTTPHNLDIKQGSTRHNFNDNYFAFTFVFNEANVTNANPDIKADFIEKFVSRDRWFETQNDNIKAISPSNSASYPRACWKASDTSFFGYNQQPSAAFALKRIIGHRLSLSLETPG